VLFAPELVELLDHEPEVDVETERANGRPRRTTVWVVVDGSQVFIRSWLGERGRWYREALALPERMAVHVAGRRVPVRAVPARDAQSIERCSRGLKAKYPDSPSTPAMVAPAVLGTTLRLEPRDGDP
jgi:hypothetical protein